ncbi:MAG TPA: hypothetical protein VFM18_07425, partial [Methanosarcina sp.]|nr:hypothetical protein [Methanosarcina sp.]
RFEKWVAALRSGEYEQTTDYLNAGSGFCCLGVEQNVNTGDVERFENGASRALPSDKYLIDNSIIYIHTGNSDKDPQLHLKIGASSASKMNDQGRSFSEIADALVANFISLEEIKELLEKESV